MTTNTQNPRTLDAKFAGRCRDCGGEIFVGDKVLWFGRGQGVEHAAKQEVCFPNREAEQERRAFDMKMQRDEIMGLTDDCPF